MNRNPWIDQSTFEAFNSIQRKLGRISPSTSSVLQTSKMIDQLFSPMKNLGLGLYSATTLQKLAGVHTYGYLKQILDNSSRSVLRTSGMTAGQLDYTSGVVENILSSHQKNFTNVGSIYRVIKPINSWATQTQSIQKLIQQSVDMSNLEALNGVIGTISSISNMDKYGAYFEQLSEASRIISSTYFEQFDSEVDNSLEPQTIVEEATELREQVGPQVFDELAGHIGSDYITIPLSWKESAWWSSLTAGQQGFFKFLLAGAIYVSVLFAMLMVQVEFQPVELFMDAAGISPHAIAAGASSLVGVQIVLKKLRRKPDEVYYRQHPIDKRIRQRVEIWNEDPEE